MADDSKFAIVSPKSVKLYAEIFGVQSLTDDLASSLAEDVTYRLRETLQSASQFMKHSKRRRLTCEDFNKALETSSTEPIYGYGSLEDMLFRSTTTKDGDIFYVEDKEIGLRELAMNVAIPTDPGQRTVKAYWLPTEGSPAAGGHAQQNGGRVNNVSEAGVVQHTLSEACLSYYEQITKAVLGDEEQCSKVALRDLKTNPKISSLLAYFVNFIASGVKTYSHDLTQLSKLLSMVRSLIDNLSLFLEPYVIQLVTAVMYCLLESLAASLNPQNDHWRLRDEAAYILARISRKCSNPVNYLRQQLLMTLQEVLLDDGRPFCSHYGAVVGLTELGPEALEQYVMPHLRTYWNQLQQVLDDNSQSNAPLQEEAYQVYGALLQAAGCLLKSKQHGVPMTTLGFQVNNSHPVLRSNLSPWAGASVIQRPAPVASSRSRSSSTSHASNPLQLYQQLYEVFGDSLGPRIAHNNWQDAAVTKTNQLRMQPFAHAYFPLRPLPRDANIIKELICKAKEKLKPSSSQSSTLSTKRKRTIDEKTSETQKDRPKSKRICLTVRPVQMKVSSIPMDLDPEEPSPSRTRAIATGVSRRSSQKEPAKALRHVQQTAKINQKRLKCAVETGRIRRKFRKQNLSLNNRAKYDYHIGVTL
ncbi:hypothetical protein ACROYT_G039802 [Oculina patagonica]